MASDPQPGDFAVVSASGPGGLLISAMETIAYSHETSFDHAFIYLGGGMIAQAETSGAQITHLGTYDHILWSAGLLDPTPAQRDAICAAARGYVTARTGYSFLDYAAIAAHRFHIPVPGLRRYIASTHRMICSQLVDQCWQDAGYRLFSDGRWPGYVSPFDLGQLLLRLAA